MHDDHVTHGLHSGKSNLIRQLNMILLKSKEKEISTQTAESPLIFSTIHRNTSLVPCWQICWTQS